jgi:CRISPR-associated protein Csb2
MSLTISIRFLTGRAHLHPWQSHHSEGRVEWPPSQWRLLRAIVAVAGRGLTSLPHPDEVPLPDVHEDKISLSRLAAILSALSRTPFVWLPRTSGGHTRQYFPIHEAGVVKNTGSAVFDTFATIAKNLPILFDWPEVSLDKQQHLDLNLVLARMTYFGRAESWSQAQAYAKAPDQIDGIITEGLAQTHWRCVCIDDGTRPDGKEYRDYGLERRLAPLPLEEVATETVQLLPRTKAWDGNKRGTPTATMFTAALKAESAETLLLRCLLRESGQDIKDGLERPIGTRWVHYAVPRVTYNVSLPKSSRPRQQESINLVRYALNTSAVNRPVLPAVTDTLLIADRFRSAVMALCAEPSANLSGHEADGAPCDANQHAYWWPIDEDNDGFIDQVIVWSPGGFDIEDVDALRRLTRLRQRGGRPDLLVTPTFVGPDSAYQPWRSDSANDGGGGVTTFFSATPYFCPLHLSHGRGKSGRNRPIAPELLKSLKLQAVIASQEEVSEIREIVFEHAPVEPASTLKEDNGDVDLSKRFRGAMLRNPDTDLPFGMAVGLRVDNGIRFIRAMSFTNRRRRFQAKGPGRMFLLRFRTPKQPRPFAIGDQAHFGLGLFVPLVCDGSTD